MTLLGWINHCYSFSCWIQNSPGGVALAGCGASQDMAASEQFFGVDRIKRPFSAYSEGDGVFHSCNSEGGTSGTPSAFVFKKRVVGLVGGTLFLHCFACSVSSFPVESYDPPLYNCSSIQLLGPGGKLQINPGYSE